MTVYQAPQEIETVRDIKVQIGDEWIAMKFARAVPHEEAVNRARAALDSMSRTPGDPQ